MERQERYTVLKISDVHEALSVDETEQLIELEQKVSTWREVNGKPPMQCVVVESDWPEYGQTWAAIAARVDRVPLHKAAEDQDKKYGDYLKAP